MLVLITGSTALGTALGIVSLAIGVYLIREALQERARAKSVYDTHFNRRY